MRFNAKIVGRDFGFSIRNTRQSKHGTGGLMMIQWCEDCKHDFATDNYSDEYCAKCLNKSKPSEIPVGYEQIEKQKD